MTKTATVYRINDRAIACYGEVALTGHFSETTGDNQIFNYFLELSQACSTCFGGVRIEIQNSNRIA